MRFSSTRDLLLSIALLASCSPYVYESEVETFAAGVTEAAGYLETQREVAQAFDRQTRRALYGEDRPLLNLASTCSSQLEALLKALAEASDQGKPAEQLPQLQKQAAAACHLEVGSGRDTEPVDFDLPIVPQAEAVQALVRYSTILRRVVDVRDREAFNAAAAKACGTVQELAESAQTTTGGTEDAATALGTATKELCSLTTEATGVTLDSLRFKALKRAVTAADPHVNTLASYLESQAGRRQARIIRGTEFQLDKPIGRSRNADEPEAYLAALDEAVTKAGELKAVLLFNPSIVFASMREAHASLAEAVQDENRQIEQAAAAIERFYGQATAAHKALTALQPTEPPS